MSDSNDLLIERLREIGDEMVTLLEETLSNPPGPFFAKKAGDALARWGKLNG